jgi:hypothetical protein
MTITAAGPSTSPPVQRNVPPGSPDYFTRKDWRWN